MNLVGVEQHAIKRGHLLASADALAGSRVMDVELTWLAEAALPGPREFFVLHIGTAEVSARVTFHHAGSQQARFARLRLREEAIAVPGDRFVLRRPSPSQTVGGGVIIDAFPPPRLNRMKTLARLEALCQATPALKHLSRRIQILIGEATQGRSINELVRMTGASRAQIVSAIAKSDAVLMSTDEQAVTRLWVEDKRRAIRAWLREFHKANPTAAGASITAARLGLDSGLAALVFRDFEGVRMQGDVVALAVHKAQFSAQDAAALQKMEDAFRAAGYQPPSLAEAIAVSGVEAKKARALVDSLIKSSRLVRLPDDLIFHSDVIAHIRNSLAQQKGRRFSVVEFKTWTNVSRKFAIPLLEYLDQQRVTRRDGEVRVVL